MISSENNENAEILKITEIIKKWKSVMEFVFTLCDVKSCQLKDYQLESSVNMIKHNQIFCKSQNERYDF